jgi:thioredoxin-related protein
MTTPARFVLPVAKTLDANLKAALAREQPVIVLVSLDGCPFCKVVRENYLRSVLQEDGITVVQVDMRKATLIKDFSGHATTHEQLIKSWGIKLAPTVLFFGKDGKEVVERLVGGSNSDFYGAYLQQRIEQATALIK